MCFCEAGVVAIVVLRDVALVGGAVYKRADSFDWKVRGNYISQLYSSCNRGKNLYIINVFFSC